MFSKSEETSPPDTILSSGNFLLRDLMAQIKQASEGSSPPSGITLQAKDGLEDLQISILGLCHDHMLARHFGISKTSELLQWTFWWPRREKDHKRHVESCTTCIRNKNSKSRAWGLLKPLPVPNRPWRMISIDFIVELPPSEGYNTIFVVVDRLSKMAHFLPTKGTPSAQETPQIFIKEIISLHGVPANIVSDRGV